MLWIPHFETDLEIMDYHIAKGDEVVWMDCNGELPFCQPNPDHKKSKCKECVKRKNKGLKLLNRSVRRIPLGRIDKNVKVLPDVKNIEELKKHKLDHLEGGLGTVSSLISVVRDPSPDLGVYGDIWKRAYFSTYNIYVKAQNIFKEEYFDRVYIFNGRYANEKGILNACQKANLEYFIHERGRDKDHYMIYENAMPHNIAAFKMRMEKMWSESEIAEEDKYKIGAQFYTEREKGKIQSWVSFTNDQNPDVLPENWDNKKTNITIYMSSEDEMASISDEWRSPVYSSQLQGIKMILSDCSQGINFYLRIHPNLMGVKNKELDELLSLSYPNLTIIPAASPVSSYSMMKNSTKVLTFGSTAGIEATFWGIPSILAGVSFYRGIGATYDANSHEDVIKLIKDDLQPKDKLTAIKYGYYQKSFGEKYLNYKAQNFYFGTYKGKSIYGNWFYSNVIRTLSTLKILLYVKRKIKKFRHFLNNRNNLGKTLVLVVISSVIP